MKSNLFKTISVSLCAVILSANAYALTTDVADSTYDEISSALENSSAVMSYLSPEISVKDLENDEIYDTAPNKVKAQAALQEKRIKFYGVSVNSNTTSVYSNLEENNDLWVVASDIDNSMAFTFLKKGEAFESVQARINALNLDNSYKERMLQAAQERAGKWYVMYVAEQNSYDNANSFIDETSIQNLLSEKGIDNIVDLRYIYIRNNNTLALCVKTSDSEYILPYVTSVETGALYSVEEFKNYILIR